MTAVPVDRRRQLFAAVVLAACLGLVGGSLAAWAIYARFGPVERVITQTVTVGGSGGGQPVAQTVGSVAQAAIGSVVEIATRPITAATLLSGGAGLVDGFAVSADGLVVTSIHAIRGATSLSIATGDGRSFPATIVRADAGHGIAVLRAVGAAGLTPLGFAATDARAGDDAIAVARAPYSPLTLSTGPVSSSGITLTLSDGEPQLSDVLTVDATPDPREDGAPLLSGGGQVIGVVLDAGSSSPGVVALSGRDAATLVQAVTGGAASGAPTLGAESVVLDAATAAAAGLQPGALIRSVVPGGAAATAGLQPGDVVTAVDGTHVDASHPFDAVALGLTPDQQVSLSVERAGSALTFTLTVGGTGTSGQ